MNADPKELSEEFGIHGQQQSKNLEKPASQTYILHIAIIKICKMQLEFAKTQGMLDKKNIFFSGISESIMWTIIKI